MEMASSIQELLKGQEERGELNALQRLGKAAAEPLMRLGTLILPSEHMMIAHERSSFVMACWPLQMSTPVWSITCCTAEQ